MRLFCLSVCLPCFPASLVLYKHMRCLEDLLCSWKSDIMLMDVSLDNRHVFVMQILGEVNTNFEDGFCNESFVLNP